jgi:hypothetical protein
MGFQTILSSIRVFSGQRFSFNSSTLALDRERDSIVKNAMQDRHLPFPRFMKSPARISLLILCALVTTTFADDFKSITFDVSSPQPIRVHDGQFLFIRNFTQEMDTSDRGVVTVAKPNSATGTPVNVLAAAVLDQTPVEVINSVVIAGPADVTVSCGASGGNCFVSYKKEGN